MIGRDVINDELPFSTARVLNSISVKRRAGFIFSVATFYLALCLGYAIYVAPNFEYSGFVLNADPLRFTEALLLTILLATIAPVSFRKPSDFLLVLFVLFVSIPQLAIYSMRSEPRHHLYLMLLGSITLIAFSHLPRFRFLYIKHGRMLGLALSTMGVLTVAIWLISQGGLNYLNFDITRVYEFRSDVTEEIGVGVFRYLNTWAFKVFSIVLIAWFLWKRNYYLLAGTLALQVLFFGISNHKAVALYPVIVLGVYFTHRFRLFIPLVAAGLALVVIGATLIYGIFGEGVPASLFVRRLFFVPASLTFTYYEFFEVNPFVYLSNSIFSFFSAYPYTYDYQHVISEHLRGTPDVWYNNGFLATSYMHFGAIGVFLYSAIVGLIIRLVDSITANRLPAWFAVSCVVVPFYSLFVSADLTTTLLTHGLGIALLILWLLSSRNDTPKPMNTDAL